MMDPSCRCYIPSFVEISQLVPEEKSFETCVFTIYGSGGYLGHVTSIMLVNFHFLVPKSLHKNSVENGSVVLLEKHILIFACK